MVAKRVRRGQSYHRSPALPTTDGRARAFYWFRSPDPKGVPMKAQLRSTAFAACLLAPVAFTAGALPTAAFAQAPLQVQSLDVRTDGPMQPGTRLHFRMEGTPHARAMVRIHGVRESVPLREVERGIYVGRYVITRADDIEPGAAVRAILRNGNRTAVSEFNVPTDVAA